MSDSDFFWGTGRRKSSVARVRIKKGTGEIVINKKSLEDYFPVLSQRQTIVAPLTVTNSLGKYDILVNVKGGGG
ncbi:MAG TPA: 30S ribosomal protein S9, partial [Planctomycetota bacterium]|nr:30S ribosomal protein S9 [Planctomycetota bacterium]